MVQGDSGLVTEGLHRDDRRPAARSHADSRRDLGHGGLDAGGYRLVAWVSYLRTASEPLTVTLTAMLPAAPEEALYLPAITKG